MMSGWCKQGRVWKNVEINDEVHMICFINEGESYKVLLTNLMEIWMEVLTHETMFRKCQTLNPLVNLDVYDWKQPVMDMLHDIPKYIIEASVNQIKLRKDKGFPKLRFSLELLKGTPQQFWGNVTMPLCLSSMELIRQHEILLDLVKRKDEEIAEYKAEGAELVRKYIATKSFNEELFQIDTVVPVANDFVKTFQSMLRFYNTINLPKLEIKRELEEEFEIALEDASLGDANIRKKPVTVRDVIGPTLTVSSEGSHDDTDPKINESTFSNLDTGRQSCSKTDECKNKTNPSTSKIPILKLRNTSHTIQKSSKKNKKSLNDLIL